MGVPLSASFGVGFVNGFPLRDLGALLRGILRHALRDGLVDGPVRRDRRIDTLLDTILACTLLVNVLLRGSTCEPLAGSCSACCGSGTGKP